MRILVNRFISDRDATLSAVSIDGVGECFGLEDEYRAHKIPAETRIPAVVYHVGVRTWGGTHIRYAKRFPALHRGMLEVMNVLNFTDILIHIGNTDDDTAGCLLVGQPPADLSGPLILKSSALAYGRLYSKVIGAALAGTLTIEYKDNDL